MICPSCKCEYRAGVTQCSDCGVPLVDTLGAPAAPLPGDGSVFTIWDGHDPRDFAQVKEALDKAGIPFMGPVPTGYFILPSTRPKLEVAVSLLDRERAEKVMLELEALGDDPDELTPEEREGCLFLNRTLLIMTRQQACRLMFPRIGTTMQRSLKFGTATKKISRIHWWRASEKTVLHRASSLKLPAGASWFVPNKKLAPKRLCAKL